MESIGGLWGIHEWNYIECYVCAHVYWGEGVSLLRLLEGLSTTLSLDVGQRRWHSIWCLLSLGNRHSQHCVLTSLIFGGSISRIIRHVSIWSQGKWWLPYSCYYGLFPLLVGFLDYLEAVLRCWAGPLLNVILGTRKKLSCVCISLCLKNSRHCRDVYWVKVSYIIKG